MSENYEKVCTALNYTEHFLILDSTIRGCISLFAFTFLTRIPMGIIISAIGWKICAITKIIISQEA